METASLLTRSVGLGFPPKALGFVTIGVSIYFFLIFLATFHKETAL